MFFCATELYARGIGEMAFICLPPLIMMALCYAIRLPCHADVAIRARFQKRQSAAFSFLSALALRAFIQRHGMLDIIIRDMPLMRRQWQLLIFLRLLRHSAAPASSMFRIC